MKFTTLIPTHFNDGSEVSEEQLHGFIDGLAVQFGGCSDEGVTKGHRDSNATSHKTRGESMEKTKPQQALEFVQEHASRGMSATDLHKAFFGNGGKFAELFLARADREAFLQTEEYQRISQIRESLRAKEKAAS